jgi:hypothetical protein
VNRVRVYIATTEGPVEIQRLAEEDPEVHSVVCLNGTSEALPISSGYDAFVRRPTGIIERLFGHPAYRMDVSQRIGEGRSWQLGALAAHALKAEGRLAGKEERPDHILWATGEVDSTLKVRPVGHLREKLLQSAPLFEVVVREQKNLSLIVPTANREGISDDLIPDGAEVFAVEDTADLFQVLRIEAVGSDTPSAIEKPAAPRRSAPEAMPVRRANRIPMVAGGLAAAIAIVVAGFMFHSSTRKAASRDETTGVEPTTVAAERERAELTVYELRAPQGSNCAAVRFGKVAPEQTELPPATSGNYTSNRIDMLCGLAFRLVGSGKNARLKLQTRFIEGDSYFESSSLFPLSPQMQPEPEANWRVIFRRRFREGFRYEITTGTRSGEPQPILHSGN